MLVRAENVTLAGLLCAAILLSAGCASVWPFRGTDTAVPEFTYRTPVSDDDIPAGKSVLVSVDYSDRGSGVVPDRVWFVVVPPRGEVLRFEESEDFLNRSGENATIMLRAEQNENLQPGVWTVNVYAEDRTGNLATITWVFRIAR